MIRRIIDLSALFHLGTSFVLLIAALIQALTFVLLARGLGPDSFGRLMVIQASAQLALEVVSVGAGEALIRQVSRDRRRHSEALGHALIVTFVTGISLATGLSALGGFLFHAPVKFTAIAIFMIGELIGNRLGTIAEQDFIGHSKVGIANVVRIILVVPKLVAIYLCTQGFGSVSLSVWIIVQGFTTFSAGLACLMFAVVCLGNPTISFLPDNLRFGALITVTHLARSVQFNADRIALSIVAAPPLVAVYSAATRGIQFALIPIVAILRNQFAAYFAAGTSGLCTTWKLGLSNLPKVIIIGVFTGGALIAGADVFAKILGPGFSGMVSILRWLSAVAILQGIQYLVADVLTGAEYQFWRTTISLGGAIGYIILITGCVLSYGISGLIAAIYLNQIVMIICYLTTIYFLTRRERNLVASQSTSSVIQ